MDTETIKLKLDRGDVLKGIKQVEGAIDKTKASGAKPLPSNNLFSNLSKQSNMSEAAVNKLKAGLVGLVGAISVASMVKLGKSSLDFARTMDDTARRLRITTDEVQVFDAETDRLGLSVSNLENAMKKLVESAGMLDDPTSRMSEAFRILGINVEEFISADKVRKVELMGKALQSAGDSAEVARAQITILGGREGLQLRELFESLGNGVVNLADELDRAGRLASSDDIRSGADAVREFDDAWDRLVKETLPAVTSAINTIKVGVEGLGRPGHLEKVVNPVSLFREFRDRRKSEDAREQALANAQKRMRESGSPFMGGSLNVDEAMVQVRLRKEDIEATKKAAEELKRINEAEAAAIETRMVKERLLAELKEANKQKTLEGLEKESDLQNKIDSLKSEAANLDVDQIDQAIKIEEINGKRINLEKELSKMVEARTLKETQAAEEIQKKQQEIAEEEQKRHEEYMNRLSDIIGREEDFAFSQLDIAQQKLALEQELSTLNRESLEGRERSLEIEMELLSIKEQQTAEAERLSRVEEARIRGLESVVDSYDRQGAKIRGLTGDIEELKKAQAEGIRGSDEALKKANEELDRANMPEWLKKMKSEAFDLEDVLMNIASGSADGFESLEKSLERVVLQMIAAVLQAQLLEPLMKSIFEGVGTPVNPGEKSSGGSSGGGGFFSSLVSGVGDFFGGLFAHTGRRFHNGGMPGMSGDEIPVIARRGESIVPPASQQALNGGSGSKQDLRIVTFDDREKVDEYLAKHPQAIILPLSENKEVFKQVMSVG